MNDVVFFMSMTTLMTSKYTFLQKANAVGEFDLWGIAWEIYVPNIIDLVKVEKWHFCLSVCLFIY